MTVRALASVNLAAVERNCARLAGELHGGAELCVVVKAFGYGHGDVPVARAALAGGARRLAVATAQEAAALRDAGLDAPVLIMGALSADELPLALDTGADLAVWREDFVDALARAAERPVGVHVKLDTGMGRLGTRDRAEATRVVNAVAAAARLQLAGVWTHFATADELGDSFFAEQLDRFRGWAGEVRAAHPEVVVHAANSAATLRDPASHFDMVRCGIAVYGMDPFLADPDARDLEPALELRSYVAEVKPAAPGESVGYGRSWVADRPTNVAVLPIGYADGVRRGLANRADVLIGGRRYPLAGTISMDNLTVDVGPDAVVTSGQPATLIGRDGDHRILAEEVAGHLATINYEVTCGISQRVPRTYHRDGVPADG